jgi:flagellar motility protein MotE (MotC chaperone)
MIARIQIPRLLPVTIAMIVVVLGAKSFFLLRSFVDGGPAALIAAAWASAPEAPAKVAAKPAELAPGKPEKTEGKPSVVEPPRADVIPQAIPQGPPPVSESEKVILLDLRDRRRELETREATLSARESMVAAAETKLSERVEELQSLQKKLESLDASHRQQEDVAWQGLVKVYETMKPRDAAAIFNELGMQVLLSVVDRMKEAKTAAILAAMLPEKARDVTMQLAMARTKASSALENGDKPALTPATEKAPGSGT